MSEVTFVSVMGVPLAVMGVFIAWAVAATGMTVLVLARVVNSMWLLVISFSVAGKLGMVVLFRIAPARALTLIIMFPNVTSDYSWSLLGDRVSLLGSVLMVTELRSAVPDRLIMVTSVVLAPVMQVCGRAGRMVIVSGLSGRLMWVAIVKAM